MRRIALFFLLCACEGDGGSSGLEANLRVAGAEYVEGGLPAVSTDGPAVTLVSFGYTRVVPGLTAQPLQGRMAKSGQAVAVQLADDPGYWIVPGGIVDIFNNGEITFNAQLSYSSATPVGVTQLVFSAVDGEGRYGARNSTDLTVADEAMGQALDVRLTWDTESDADLHLALPDGKIIWAQQATGDGGLLDVDSNASCTIDGRREENVIFAQSPPIGTYTVRVDLAKLCGQPVARWHVEVFAAGQSIAQASGSLGPEATRGLHDKNAGVLALTFEVN